jgi:hypothetical protein
MKKQFKYKKFLIIFAAIIAVLAVVWFGVRAIFPLPVNSNFSTEKEIIQLDTIPEEYMVNTYSYVTKLKDGNILCCYSITPWYPETDEYKGEFFFYIINEEGKVIKKITMPADNRHIESVLTLENGNIGVFYWEEILDEKFTSYLTEYSPTLDEISKNRFPEGVSPRYVKYADGLYYSGFSYNLCALDEDLNIIKEYPVPEPENEFQSNILSFSQASDGTVFLTEQQYIDKKGNFRAVQYNITDVKTGEKTKLKLPEDALLNMVSTLKPGDEKFDFYATMSSSDTTIDNLLNYDVHGIYLCGINRDGSYEKLQLIENGNENYQFFTNSYKIDNKRYSAYYERNDETRTRDLYLYVYTAVYED